MAPPPKRTPEGDAVFFSALENAHPVAAACRAAGYAVPSVYRWRNEDAVFAARWRDALTMAGDLLEDEADRRGRDGVDQPVFYRGKEVGQKRRYSDPLLLARLKAIRPSQYRDRVAPAALSDARPINVRVRDFGLESAILTLLRSGTITFSDIDASVRPRVEGLMAGKDLSDSDPI